MLFLFQGQQDLKKYILKKAKKNAEKKDIF